eukprot:Nitzschia sp. Nitz4//scaffold339_size21316//2885//5262//NITZ4_008613-RA/size21316-processed-gene-0.20-mRNA-1//-1//CDS//3329548348//2208//frame0
MVVYHSMDKARIERKKAATGGGAGLKLFVRDVRDLQGRKRPITVRSWSSIKDVKDTIQRAIDIPASCQRLYFGPLLTSGKELPNHRSLHDIGIYRSGETILLDIQGSCGMSTSPRGSSYSRKVEAKSDISISSSVIDSTPKPLRQLIQRARRALAVGLKPEFILDGSGGTYFLHDARKVKIGVFKPADEEPYAENNPRGYLPQAGEQQTFLREGIVPGESCIREVAAFMLDHGGFSHVPMTTLVEARHATFNNNGSRLKVYEGGASIGAHSLTSSSNSAAPLPKKVGSFQEFAKSDCTMDDISPSMIGVDEVHRIAILDIRLMNADRNPANLLCRRSPDNTIGLIPIDHGFCLRDLADVSWMDWCWLDWPQMKEPMNQQTKDYILNLNIQEDARLLRERLNIKGKAMDYFYASCSLLKAGVRAGLSLYEIAVMCCRNDNFGEVPSKLEVLFSMATELAGNAVENGRWHHAAASRAIEEQLSPQGGSLLSPVGFQRGSKAASAIDLSHLSEGLASLQVGSKKKDTQVPGMIQSSASDSSSDNGEMEPPEECDEWAAIVVADVSLDKSLTLVATKTRSHSIDSESSSDSQEGGFWQRKPGSVDLDDDDSISWSPASSPKVSSFMELVEGSMAMTGPPSRKTPTRSETDSAMEEFRKSRDPMRVSFAANSPKRNHGGLSLATLEHSKSDIGEDAVPSPPRPVSGIKRSLSYSALSSVRAESRAGEDEVDSKLPLPVDNGLYREYFIKFVDLVIVRETSAAARPIKVDC